MAQISSFYRADNKMKMQGSSEYKREQMLHSAKSYGETVFGGNKIINTHETTFFFYNSIRHQKPLSKIRSQNPWKLKKTFLH